MMSIQSIKVLVLLLTFTIVGCSSQIVLPTFTETACAFVVTDDRADPDYMYPTGAPIQSRITPPLAQALKGAVCASGTTTALDRASFVVTDFTCTSAGFATINYVVALRGLLKKPDGSTVELRAGNKLNDGSPQVPTGCTAAAKPVLPDLANQIREAVQ